MTVTVFSPGWSWWDRREDSKGRERLLGEPWREESWAPALGTSLISGGGGGCVSKWQTVTSPQEVCLLLRQRQEAAAGLTRAGSRGRVSSTLWNRSSVTKAFFRWEGKPGYCCLSWEMFFHSTDKMTSNLDLPLAFSELLERRIE